MTVGRLEALLLALAIGAAPPAPAGAQPPPGASRRADSLLRDLAARDLFQGAAVLGHVGRVTYAGGFGFADRERRVPFTADTPTDGASIAKPFTAAALLLLAQEGRVDLEAPVGQILPGYPHAATRVRHLLAHSAGLPSYEWLDHRAPPGQVRTNTGHLALVARDAPTPAFPPGTAFAYDNVAYDVAALVIERASGRSYAQVIAERFARPLKLRAFVRPARFADWKGARTRGYRRTDAGWEPNDSHDLEGFHGAANIYLSARDLHRWMAGYRRLVGPAGLRAAAAPARLDDGRTAGISRGSWYVSADGQRRYYTGHHAGFFSFGYADDARSLTVSWVANDTPPPWLQPALSRALIAVAEGRAPERLAAPAALAFAGDPAGSYLVPEVGSVTVLHHGEGIRVRLRDVEYDAFPIGDGVRYVPGMDAYLSFRPGASGPGGPLLVWNSVYVVATAPRLAVKASP